MALSSPLSLPGGILVTLFMICLGTWMISTVRFLLDAKKHQENQKRNSVVRVPLKPYFLPVLGSTLSFSNRTIGRFWDSLLGECRSWSLRVVSVLLAGTRTYIFFTPSHILTEFRTRHLTRHKHARLLAINVLGMSKQQAAQAFPESLDSKTQVTLERVHTEYLLAPSQVTILTNSFMECLLSSTSADKGIDEGREVELYAWIKDKLFQASTTALFGSELLRMHPDLDRDFWVWEQSLIALLFGTPRIFARKAYAARESLLEKLTAWLDHGYRQTASLDDSVEWEPYFGAKVMRKRHEYYNQQKLSLRSQAGKEMIFLAGILSNAIPTIGWLLAHILSPTSAPDLKSRIVDEVKTALRTDGSVDVPTLTKLPLLNSTLNEVLRLYIDLLIIRQVDENCIVDNIPMLRGEQIMASSWMTHRHADNFTRPTEFDPERFLRRDPKTGECSLSTVGLGGKYFPFGGGHHMCPGRSFARQEILGTVAILLLNFDIAFMSFIERKGDIIEKKGSGTAGFPSMVNALPGNQVMGLKGDLLIRVQKRKTQ